MMKVQGIEVYVCKSCLSGDHLSYGQDHRQGEKGRCGCKNVSGGAQCACNPEWEELTLTLEDKR